MNKLRILIGTLLLCTTGLTAEAAPWTLRACIDYARSRNIQVQSAQVSDSSAGVNLLPAKSQQTPTLSLASGPGVPHGHDDGPAYSARS